METRKRAQAFTGKGYGSLRYQLFVAAKDRIEKSIKAGYFCEAIAISESVIGDRLESRYSYLKKENVGFKTLGSLIKGLENLETDGKMIQILEELNTWRNARNKALHELVKVEDGVPHTSWNDRMTQLKSDAESGYALLCSLYHRVADLNPLHSDRVFPQNNFK